MMTFILIEIEFSTLEHGRLTIHKSYFAQRSVHRNTHFILTSIPTAQEQVNPLPNKCGKTLQIIFGVRLSSTDNRRNDLVDLPWGSKFPILTVLM